MPFSALPSELSICVRSDLYPGENPNRTPHSHTRPRTWQTSVRLIYSCLHSAETLPTISRQPPVTHIHFMSHSFLDIICLHSFHLLARSSNIQICSTKCIFQPPFSRWLRLALLHYSPNELHHPISSGVAYLKDGLFNLEAARMMLILVETEPTAPYLFTVTRSSITTR